MTTITANHVWPTEMRSKWRYDETFANGTEAKCRRITDKQINYIQRLRRGREFIFHEILTAVNHSDLASLTVGEAMFITKCLLGEIMPYVDGLDGEGI